MGGACRRAVHADVSETLTVLPVFFFKVLWTTSWYSYSGTYILDAEELHEKAVLFLCIETCGVRKWGNTKKNGGVGYVTSTCCMA